MNLILTELIKLDGILKRKQHIMLMS